MNALADVVTVLEGLITKHNSYIHIESGKFG